MIQTYYSTPTITISVHTPYIFGGNYIRSIDESISSYSHTISAVGGFISASISIASSEIEVDDWLTNGIGRHIVSYGVGGETVWEGFVDNVSVGMGNITISRGRLTEICNRCSVLYTPIISYDDTMNPVGGTQISTVVSDDEKSIKKYGIWEKIASAGLLITDRDPITSLTPAELLRNTYMEDHKEPEISHSAVLVADSSGDVTVTLDCKGYIEWTNNYVYNNDISAPFTTDVTAKIIAVLAEDPNDIISTSIHGIQYNGVLIGMPEDQSRNAAEVINECVEMGGSNYERWIFGIYENRTPRFEPFSSTVDYYYYMSGGNQKILNTNGTEIYPWNVRPGKIVFIPDTYLGGLINADLRTDPRVMYLEQVVFTAPNTISLEGKKVYTFDRMSKQFGLTGGL